jgi:hypothetical protein
MKQCHQCATMLPDEARYCMQCGVPQFQLLEDKMEDQLDLKMDLPPQLNHRFFQALRHRVAEEQSLDLLQQYVDRLHEYGFIETVRLRNDQLAEEIRELVARSGADQVRIGQLINETFDTLLDFFTIHHCKDFNKILLPESILKYQEIKLKEIDLYRMVLDYLDFGREDEEVYLADEFFTMPADKLRNAGKHFLFPAKNERIFLICDQSLFGSCREGFAFTEKALYWKAHLQKPRQVIYTDIRSVKREKEWITINDFFFNVNSSLNVKIMKLMRKLQRLMV